MLRKQPLVTSVFLARMESSCIPVLILSISFIDIFTRLYHKIERNCTSGARNGARKRLRFDRDADLPAVNAIMLTEAHVGFS